jgi:hypothetical protein
LKRKRNLYIFLLIAALFLVVKSLNWFNQSKKNIRSFRDANHLILTSHAKCRMNCRHITKEEIKEILKDGRLNKAKSGIGSKGDSTFALEGYSLENQHIRVVVAPESDGLVIITCIDLERDWPCNCH